MAEGASEQATAAGEGVGLGRPAARPSSAAAAAAAAAAAVKLLAPKRKLSGSVARVDTMAAFEVECSCRSSKACSAARPASGGGAGSGGAPLVRCSYYQPRRQLYCFQEAPAALRFNKHIRSGYRAGYSYSQCCRSILDLHNETCAQARAGLSWCDALGRRQAGRRSRCSGCVR